MMSEKRRRSPKRQAAIITAVYVILMAALVLVRFPATVNEIAVRYKSENVSPALDQNGNEILNQFGEPVTLDLQIHYDQGKGYQYEKKGNTVINQMNAGLPEDGTALFHVCMDGKQEQLYNLNTLDVGMKKLRIDLLNQPGSVLISSVEFLKDGQVKAEWTAQELMKNSSFSGDVDEEKTGLTDGGLLVVSKGSDAFLEIETGFGTQYHHLFYRFGLVNILLMLFYTAAYAFYLFRHQISAWIRR